MDYLVVTNNNMTKNLVEKNEHIKLVFLEETVQGVLNYCKTLLENGGVRLAADPMGGRRARPFPCLTIILQETDRETPARDWERIMQYVLLDEKRKETYMGYDEAMRADFEVLDCSLTKSALKIEISEIKRIRIDQKIGI